MLAFWYVDVLVHCLVGFIRIFFLTEYILKSVFNICFTSLTGGGSRTNLMKHSVCFYREPTVHQTSTPLLRPPHLSDQLEG